VPAIDFQGLAAYVDGHLATLETGLSATSGILSQADVALPVLSRPVKDILQAKNVISDFRNQLKNGVAALNGMSDEQTIKRALFGVLGPKGGIDVLGDTNRNGVDQDDVGVVFSNNRDDVEISVRLTKTFTLSTPFNFGLGLPGIPLDLKGNVNVVAGF